MSAPIKSSLVPPILLPLPIFSPAQLPPPPHSVEPTHGNSPVARDEVLDINIEEDGRPKQQQQHVRRGILRKLLDMSGDARDGRPHGEESTVTSKTKGSLSLSLPSTDPRSNPTAGTMRHSSQSQKRKSIHVDNDDHDNDKEREEEEDDEVQESQPPSKKRKTDTTPPPPPPPPTTLTIKFRERSGRTSGYNKYVESGKFDFKAFTDDALKKLKEPKTILGKARPMYKIRVFEEDESNNGQEITKHNYKQLGKKAMKSSSHPTWLLVCDVRE